MDHENKINRRSALGKFGRIGLAATATAGLADLLGRSANASAAPDVYCGGQANIFVYAPGRCSIDCQSAGPQYYCYSAYNQNTGQNGNHYCCRTTAGSPAAVLCSCTRPSIANA